MDINYDGLEIQAKLSDCRPVEPEAKEPTPGQKLAERTMKAIWVANDAVNGTPAIKEPLATKPNSSEIPNSSSDPLAPSPCMDGVDADQFIEGVMDARGRTSGLQVGDAVRFVSPGYNRHGTEGILKSIHHGPKNAYLFVSDCGQFHRYCTIAELERADQADPIDIKGSMQSLDGADTIQAGDLQWTDRDGKYRLCNFTIGMRVHEAIQRGKAHGEKWVFYRKFREVAEASGANDGPKRKQYRTPTLADLANGPIACECIGTQLDKWQPQILLEILSEAGYPYRASCPKNQHKITRWSQCRIEAGE
jgi:hypothetical protein